jgi:hypothetical protein
MILPLPVKITGVLQMLPVGYTRFTQLLTYDNVDLMPQAEGQ